MTFKRTLIMMTTSLCLNISCSSLKRVDSQPAPPKPGFSWGGPVVSGGGIQPMHWCDVRGGILTFSEQGPTEAQATEFAMKKCQSVIKSGCTLVSCKTSR